MQVNRCIKEAFSVIGKEGSTKSGAGFIDRLWEDANSHFCEIAELVKKDAHGNPGVWGLMSDFSGQFRPWEENFTKGLYLAGAEVTEDAVPPAGWTKWTVPSYEYVYIKDQKEQDAFAAGLKYLKENKLMLAGAVQDCICPAENGQRYLFFPVRKV